MTSAVVVVLGVGYVAGFWRGSIFGRHHARGLRSWRDILANTRSTRGLTRRVVRE